MIDNYSTIEYLMNVLKNKFGINSEAELDKAIRNHPVIDLSPFCDEIKNHKEAV